MLRFAHNFINCKAARNAVAFGTSSKILSATLGPYIRKFILQMLKNFVIDLPFILKTLFSSKFFKIRLSKILKESASMTSICN